MKKLNKHEGQNFAAAHLGEWRNLDQYSYTHPVLQKSITGKKFLNETLNLSGMEISMNKISAGYAMPFYHKHVEREEVYIFIQGSGQFQVDHEIIDVKEGTVIRVSPEGVRAWRNNSTEDLYYLCIQAKEGSLAGNAISDGRPVNQPVVWPE